MAVTTGDLDARVALALTSLHDVIGPGLHVDDEHRAPAAETWLDFAVINVVENCAPGTEVELPTGSPMVRVVLVVPGGSAEGYSQLGTTEREAA